MKRIFKIFTIILIFISAILFTVNVNATNTNTIEIYTNGATKIQKINIARIIGSSITLIQVLGNVIAFVIIMTASIKYIKAKKKEDKELLKKSKKRLIINTIIGIVIIVLGIFIQSTKNFAT